MVSIVPTAAPAAKDQDSVSLFKAQHRGFLDTFALHRTRRDLLDRIWMQIFTSFERHVAEHAGNQPEIACRKGCGACCRIVVVATLPEVLMMARYVRGMTSGFTPAGLDLIDRLYDTPGSGEPANALLSAARLPLCPFLTQDICAIYPVRPLGCRGHASFDEDICVSVLADGTGTVPVSEAHRTVHGLVQQALQSALRDAGLASGLYDVVSALKIALAHPECETEFLQGGDPFAAAAVDGAGHEDAASPPEFQKT